MKTKIVIMLLMLVCVPLFAQEYPTKITNVIVSNKGQVRNNVVENKEINRIVKIEKSNVIQYFFFQPGYRVVDNTVYNKNDENGFVFGTGKLGVKASKKYFGKLTAKFKGEADVSKGNFNLHDLSIQFILNKFVSFRIGQYKVPFLRAYEVSNPKKEFIAPPMVNKLSFFRDKGVEFAGKLGENIIFDYSVNIFNGVGSKELSNINERFMYTARLGLSPLGDFKYKSEADLKRNHVPKLRVAIGVAYNKNKNDMKEMRLTGDLFLKYSGLSFTTAYVITKKLIEGNAFNSKVYNHGWYVQTGYIEPILKKLEFIFRYERFDSKDNDEGYRVISSNGLDMIKWVNDQYAAKEKVDFGTVIYFSGNNLKFMLNYSIENFLEGPKFGSNGESLIGNSLALMLQFGIF